MSTHTIASMLFTESSNVFINVDAALAYSTLGQRMAAETSASISAPAAVRHKSVV